MHRNSLDTSWDEYNGWSGKYMLKLAGIFNAIKEEDVITYLLAFLFCMSGFVLGVFIHLFCYNDRIWRIFIVVAPSYANIVRLRLFHTSN